MVKRLIERSFAAMVLLLVGAALASACCGCGTCRATSFPISPPVFNVIVQNPAMGAEELETGIAIPLEAALPACRTSAASARIRSSASCR